MRIDREKLNICMARANMGMKDIVKNGIPKGTYCSAISGRNMKPKTAGRIAKVLSVDVTEIIQDQ